MKNDFSKNDAMNKNNRVVHDSQIVKPKLTSPFERKNIEVDYSFLKYKCSLVLTVFLMIAKVINAGRSQKEHSRLTA